MFWSLHSPTRPAFSQQYKSAVYAHGPEQERVAREVMARVEQRLGQRLSTEILPAGRFYLAEDYHQKYYLRQQRGLAREFAALFPDWRDFAKSTAAARANGFVGGSGEKVLLEAEIGEYGLSAEGQELLRRAAANATGIHCGS